MAIAAVFLATGRAEDSCDDGPFAPGRVGGLAFPETWDDKMTCECRWKGGDVITGIEAWSTYDHIEGIRFKFEISGWTNVHGKIPEKAIQTQLTEWEATDKVSVHIWNNQPKGYPMDAPAMIQIHRGDENIFQVGAASQRTTFPEIPGIDQGAGIILGVKARSADWVNSVEFKMLKPNMVSSELVDIKFEENMETWSKQQKGIETVSLDGMFIQNPYPVGGKEQMYEFGGTIRKENAQKLIEGTTNLWGGSISTSVGLSVGVPQLGEVTRDITVSAEYQRTKLKQTEEERKEGKDLTWKVATADGNLLKPQEAVKCSAWSLTGTFASPYTGTIRAKWADGSTFEYFTRGDFESVGWTRAYSQCEPWEISQIPSGARLGEAHDITKRAVEFRA
ncbi:hypothetical protein BCR34DRAFT_586533 [Clohesyomyces aquaticus]|uniref:Uncharacterized protein n=1 Tax=Clohesyomyces aquaticus TaxID=1231657 RepID=A0A1Y1ZT21_9PLEO|nr:hypothetical protein BCR34DRAFT_586533 [Clohesyomyces aquaticus]